MRRTGIVAKARSGAGGRGGERIAFRRTWTTPGLTPGQLLDAGITVRQSQSRKNIKKARRPFEGYFRDQFRCTLHSPPAVGRNGVLSAWNAVRLMTDAKASWGPPWAVRAAGVRSRRRRQDALEGVEASFGEDALDSVIERLIEVRFQWDREDGIVATSQVPESLFAMTEHCAPYAPEYEARAKQQEEEQREAVLTEVQENDEEESENADKGESGEYVVVDGTRIQIGGILRTRGGHPKTSYKRPKWGFTGVDTVPSLVADVVQGPLLSNSNEPRLTLRWKAENRGAESVAAVMRLRRSIATSSIVGLPPRSAFLLLKSAAATELEDPALDVALLIAVGEHYGEYQMTERLELLRCVRRLALVRGLPAIATLGTDRSSAAEEEEGSRQSQRQQRRPVGIPIYENAALTQGLLSAYIHDTAPFLASKVWAHLPEHSRRLLNQRYYLDWIDLLSLSLETTGPGRLPNGLPNASSNAKYASKYHFFRHTLGIDEAAMSDFVAHMASGAGAVAETAAAVGEGGRAGTTEYVNEDAEVRVKPLVLWVCAAFLVRLVAECLGDVLHHVGQSLQRHAQLAAEEDGECCSGDGRTRKQSADSLCLPPQPHPKGGSGPDLDSYLDRLGLPRPHLVGVPPLQGRMRPAKMRIRLLPYEAFPSVFHVLPTPARGATAQALQMEQSRRRRCGAQRTRQANTSPPPSTVCAKGTKTVLESPFASVLQHSALAAKHVERATAALEWSTMVLGHCHRLVRSLRRPAQGVGSFPVPVAAAAVLATVGDVASGDSGRKHSGPENAAVIAQRAALCERFIQSKVELLMDSVFTFIPWGEVESGIEPLLRIGKGEEEEEAGEKEAACEVEISAEAQLLAMLLEDDSSRDDDGDRGTFESPREEGDQQEELSEAEQEMRATLTRLQTCIDDFHIAVADMLDAHERFFGVEEEEKCQ